MRTTISSSPAAGSGISAIRNSTVPSGVTVDCSRRAVVGAFMAAILRRLKRLTIAAAAREKHMLAADPISA
jgi:hypothetical protein